MMFKSLERALGDARGGFPRIFDRQGSLFALTLWRLVHHRMGIAGIILLLVVLIMASFAPFLAPFDPLEMNREALLLGPSLEHPFGTDNLGRDMLSRIIFGARISMGVALFGVGVGSLIGLTTGLLAGYSGGVLSTVIMRVSDALLAFPPIFLAIGFAAVLGAGPANVALVVGILNVPTFARLARSMVLSEKEKEYVVAARAIGVADRGIMFKHLLPNCLPPVLAQFAVSMGVAVLLEAAVSFLGLGSQPPQPSWGVILRKSLSYLYLAWWFGFFPGAVLSISVLGFNFLADAVRDCLDPTYVGRA